MSIFNIRNNHKYNKAPFYYVIIDVCGTGNAYFYSRAFLKMASVYRLPVYQKLCDSGFGISEVSSFLKTANGVLTELGGEDLAHKSR